MALTARSRREDDSPRRFAHGDLLYDFQTADIDDRDIVGRTVGRIEPAAIARQCDSSRTRPDWNLHDQTRVLDVDDGNIAPRPVLTYKR